MSRDQTVIRDSAGPELLALAASLRGTLERENHRPTMARGRLPAVAGVGEERQQAEGRRGEVERAEI